jgi:sec-independent protein translocase protein TatC
VATPEPDEKVMTLVEHLSELRRRIFIAIGAIALGAIVGFYFAPQVIELLKSPLPLGRPLVFTNLGGAFMIQFKVALIIGLALASPVVLYETWAFVSPGLTPRERRTIRPWVPLSALFLVLGIIVAWLILPFTTAFLLSFQIPGVMEPLITAEAYFGFVTTLFLAFGLVMQFPILIVLLSKVGIVSAERLKRGRRYVFVGIFVFAVVVTPGGDPFSPTIMALVMYPLYELTIWLVTRSTRQQVSAASADAAAAAPPTQS